jgi:hypothetical protein
MTGFIAATAVVALVALGFLILYVSMLRSTSEHKSAIDSAAIAAAKDISRVVIDTPEWGYVSLTSVPPTGNATRAPDNWNQEVRSLNELMATARLDLIIANELGDNFMQILALQDLAAAKNANAALIIEIQQAIVSGGTSRDAAGSVLEPYKSAEQAYLNNQAKGSSYIPGSLRLSLGSIEGGIPTSTACPSPVSKAACSGQQVEGKYLSDTNIPFAGADFVFGSVGKRVALCNISKFRTNQPSLPFQMPAVIKAEAAQQFKDQDKQWTVSFAACACAGSIEVPRPSPGALTVSFPDGPMPEMTKLADTYSYSELRVSCPMDVYTSANGDFVVDRASGAALAPYPGTIPFSSTPPNGADLAKLAIYDWLRCGGSRVDIDSAIASQSIPFASPASPMTAWNAPSLVDPTQVVTVGMVPTGIMHIYSIDRNGVISYKSTEIKPAPYTVVGENQLYAELQDSGDITSSVPKWRIDNIPMPASKGGTGSIEGTQSFNLYVRDLSRVLGATRGGKHAGERLDQNPQISHTVYDVDYRRDHGSSLLLCKGGGGGMPPMISRQDDFASSTVPAPEYYTYSTGPGGGAPRPAYGKTGLSADIRFRRLIHVGDLDFLIGGSDYGYIGEMR